MPLQSVIGIQLGIAVAGNAGMAELWRVHPFSVPVAAVTEKAKAKGRGVEASPRSNGQDLDHAHTKDGKARSKVMAFRIEIRAPIWGSCMTAEGMHGSPASDARFNSAS